MTDADPKSLLTSKGVWGGVTAAVAGALPILGAAFGLDADLQGQVLEVVAAAGALVGGLVAIWGRISATRRIG